MKTVDQDELAAAQKKQQDEADAEREVQLHNVLNQQAKARYFNLKSVKPATAKQIRDIVLGQKMNGILGNDLLTEDELVMILKQLAKANTTTSVAKTKFHRKADLSSDIDDDSE